MAEQFAAAQVLAEGWSASEVLGWAFNLYGGDIAIASAFGPEGIVIIDLASQISPRPKVFTLDTGFLFPETHELIDRVERHYQIRVERVYPELSSEEQVSLYGPALWSRDPDQCCRLRKVQPLTKKLSELRAWVTGIRREQTPSRALARKVEWDAKFGLIKVNPLVDWTMQAVWDHIRRSQLPYNRLHERNYPSIGCVHCTRAVNPGEPPRGGRWPGFEKVECGLHNLSWHGKDPAGTGDLLPEIPKPPT